MSVAATAFAGVMLVSSDAPAQIEPLDHPRYVLEIEPHGLLWWRDASHDSWDQGQGWGLGMRVAIPVVERGIVPTVNDSLALGVGVDWGHYSHRCWQGTLDHGGDCSNNEFWIPVVAQWNVFVTRSFSLFAEPGLAIRHSRRSWPDGYCASSNGPVLCDYNDSSTGLGPVFTVGGRVGNENLSFTFRLGWPYASVGASFFL